MTDALCISMSKQGQPIRLLHEVFEGLPQLYGSLRAVDLSRSVLERWDRLALKECVPDPCSGASAWQISALEASMRRDNPVIFRQSDDGQIAFSLTTIGGSLKLVPWEAHWKFGSPLLGPGSYDLLLKTISDMRQQLPVGAGLSVEVAGFPANKAPKELISRSISHLLLPRFTHAAASLEGGFEGWRARRSTGFLRNLRRAEARAREAHVTFERLVPHTEAAASRAYARMVHVERLSWKGKTQTGLLYVAGFYESLLKRYALRGQARIVFARQNGRDIGFCCGGLLGGFYRGQQASYVEEAAHIGVGNLLHMETARWLCEGGALLHHFGPIQQSMAFKARFCELQPKSFILDLRCP